MLFPEIFALNHTYTDRRCPGVMQFFRHLKEFSVFILLNVVISVKHSQFVFSARRLSIKQFCVVFCLVLERLV